MVCVHDMTGKLLAVRWSKNKTQNTDVWLKKNIDEFSQISLIRNLFQVAAFTFKLSLILKPVIIESFFKIVRNLDRESGGELLEMRLLDSHLLDTFGSKSIARHEIDKLLESS
jgi:hypothetical protein